MRKRIMFLLVSVIAVASLLLITVMMTERNVEIADEKKELTVWGDDASVQRMFLDVYGENSDYVLNFVHVENEEMAEKIQLHLALHEPIGDICILDNSTVNQIEGEKYFADLEEEFELKKELLYNIQNEALFNSAGHLWAVPGTLSAAGMAYNRSLMEEEFGLEDPVEVRYEFNSWADLISKGKSIKRKNRDIKMFSSLSDVAMILFGQSKYKYVEDGKLLEPSRFQNYFTIMKVLQDEDLVGNEQMFSPQWYQNMKTQEILFYPCSMTLLQSGIFEMGQPWGFTRACSGSYNMTGKVWAISSNSEEKAMAYDFLHHLLLSDAGARYAKNRKNSFFIDYKPAYELEGYRNLTVSTFNGQNIGEMLFETIIPETENIERGEYSNQVEEIFMETTLRMMDDPDLTIQQCYDSFISECEKKLNQVIRQ